MTIFSNNFKSCNFWNRTHVKYETCITINMGVYVCLVCLYGYSVRYIWYKYRVNDWLTNTEP